MEFIDQLWVYCSHPLFGVYGYHLCPFCANPPIGLLTEHKGEKFTLGGAEIRVIGKNGRLYAAPDLIFHYVVDHQYRPPDSFIQAVLEGPLPGSKEYKEAAELFAWL